MTVAILVRESVVRSATATASSASSVASSPAAHSSPRPARTLSSGSRVPITPVDSSRVEPTGTPAAVASSLATSSWSVSPAGPVAAFAQPLVAMIALAQPERPSPTGETLAAR